MKKLLFFIFISFSFIIKAQTLYWVGGSGYWNDINHWSNISGGPSANRIPTANTDVVFDDNSSTAGSFTIHATNSFSIKSIYSNINNFDVSLISSPTVDLTIYSNVDLNEHFFIKNNGAVYLLPSSDVKYQFSHNKLNADIHIKSSHNVELGSFSTLKSLFLEGNLKLKNSTVLTQNLIVLNAQLELINNTIQAIGFVDVINSRIVNNTTAKSLLICNKTTLNSTEQSELNTVNNLRVGPVSPTACIVTLVSSTNPTCSGLCNGTAVFNLAGCTNPPYTIQWLNADPSPPCQVLPPAEGAYAGSTYSVNTLCGCGTQYAVLFENSVGEQFVVQVSITNPAATLLSFSQTQPTCNGLCNGQIRVNVVSGVVPLSINWNPPAVTHTNVITRDTLKNACAGVYTLTATNSNGCVNSFTTTLVQPPVLLANGSSSSVTCNGICNGSATVSPTGGTAGYTYSWVPAAVSATSTTNSGLCFGVVSVTVTDTKSCTATYSSNISQPPPITLTVTKTNLNCGSTCNGTATVAATGGSGAGFTYTWTPSVSTTSLGTALCAGIYTVNVSDNLFCTKTVTFEITSPPTLSATPTQTNINCNGVCNGAVNLNPSGGTLPYVYSWIPSVSTTSTASSLCAGAYSYTITDALLCTFINSVTITQPPALTLTIASSSVTCFGACDGVSNSNLTGGTGPYTYTWSPGSPIGQGTGTISSLCPANYTLNITDALGCLRQATTSIVQPTDITVNTTTVSPTCNGVCDGSINATVLGGSAPYSFTLQPTSGPAITTAPPFLGLCAGSYTLTVMDNNGCIKTRTINLTQPNPVTLALNSTSITCAGMCNASIATVVGGGTPLFTFLWSTGATTSFLTGQCFGVYSATVTDSRGCKANATTTVLAAPDITVTINNTNPNCFGQCTGVATAAVSGGSPTYTINWTNGDVGTISSALCQGNYTATVTDSKGCIKTETVDIIAPPALTLTPTNGTTTCAGTCDGTVSVNVTGGTPGYFYSWNSIPAQTTATATSLCAGNYIVNVTDGRGCIGSAGATVTQPVVLTASIVGVQPSCNVCIGSATTTGVGGTGPYTYSWSPGGQTTPIATGLCTGVQTVVVTDSRGCTATQTVNVSQTVIVMVTTNGSTLACNGGCSGVATANASGGLAPYTYTWSPTAPLQTASTATALCAGTYSVLVADVNGCSNTSTITFINPPAITLTVNQSNVSCGGSCNGSATATAVGGTGTISYLWQPGGFTTSSISGLCAGIYTVTATDINLCSRTSTFSITQPSTLTAAFTAVNPTGCTLNNGSITHTLTGGTAPVSFTWVPGGSVNPLTNLTDGTYVLNTTDGNGCTQSFTTTLSDPLGATVTVTSNSIACFALCTGSASLTMTGTGPFTVNWPSIPSTSSVVTSLCAGTYVAQVTDGLGCVTNQTVNINQPTQITSTGVVSNVLCSGVCTGSINLSPSGGTPGYTYSWSPAGGTVQDPTSLCVGNYTVNITDANSCVRSNTFSITQPSTITLSFNKKDVLCNGGCTGAVKVIATGGTAPYVYSWTPLGTFAGSTLDTIINLCTGVYSVTVTDINGCIKTGTINIGQPTVLTSTVTSINNLCNGLCNGSATLTASGGTAPYSFSYNTAPIATTQTVGALCTGAYIGTVTDFNGCVSTNPFNITQPLPIAVTTTVSNPKCNAVCNGSVATNVTGGSPAYSYTWIPSGGFVANPTGLCAGSYTVLVADINMCSGQALVTLTNPPTLLANASFTNPTCNGSCNRIVTANPIAAVAPISYLWSAPTNTNQTVSGLCSGDYTVVVTDANSCTDTQTLTLINPPPIGINPAITPATCGVNNGVIVAVPSTTVSNPYTYSWLPPLASTSATVSGLGAGIYSVVVTNAALCTATISIAVSNSSGPTGATITSTNVTCNGQCNGSAAVSNPVGGTPSYTLGWVSPVSTSSLITGLCAGSYTAQITDANNCLYFQSVSISEPLVISDNAVINSAKCFGKCDGQINLTPTGGNGGYTYSWSTSGTSSSISSLCPGTYSVTILDALSCSLTATYNVLSLTTITSSTFATNNLCYNYCNGSLLATSVAGGLPPYSFNWSDPLGQTTSLATNLCNGSYSVTITDANGCFDVIPGTITSPSQVTYTPNITQPSCNMCNGSATVNPVGGTPTYSLVWSNTQVGVTTSSLCAGVYAVQITDGNGCISTSSIVINSSSGITGENITSADVTCKGVCDGTVNIAAIGGTAPITYNWIHNGSSLQTQTGLCEGVYYCNMVDANGCSRTATVNIAAATSMTIDAIITKSSCSLSTGSIVVNVTGGSGIYTYNWLPSGSTATLTSLPPDTYTLTVFDGACPQTQVFSVGTTTGPSILVSSSNISCSGLCTGSASVAISGGTPGYSTTWSNGATTTSVTGLCAGSYSIIVSDVLGCKSVQNFSISTSAPIVFSSPNLEDPICHNDCNGIITSIPSGGTLPFVYNWTPVISTAPSATSLCAGVYSVSITDVNGCSASQSYTLTNPSTMTLSAIVTDASCNTVADGDVDITNGGGNSPYTYSWTPSGVITQDLLNVLSGTYSLSITDNGGCKKDTTITINSTIVVIANAGNDTSFCQNGVLQLNGNASTGGITYQWFELPSTTTISSTSTVIVTPAVGTTTYVLVATNGLCVDNDTIIVNSNALPIVDAGPFVSIPLFGSTGIGGSPTCGTATSFTWSPTVDLSNFTVSNPVSSTTVTTIYTVSVVDANGCRNSDTVTVFVYPEIKIPNGFTPNADGKNDYWQLDLIYMFPDNEVEVYNRWGEQLFYSKGYAVPFNGQYKGKDLPVGTYYYIINLNHPSYPKPYTGPLTIFR